MAEVDDILQRYGEGYRDPRLGMDSADYSTRDVLPRMHEQPWFTKAMRHLASYLPTDDREDRQRGRDEPWMNWWARTNLDSGAGPALNAMVKGGLNSSANWLEGKPTWSDMTTPLGLAAVGAAPTGALAASSFRRSTDLPALWRQAHPSTTIDARLAHERPVKAASAYGDDVFVSPNIHGGEWEEVAAKLGAQKARLMGDTGQMTEGFVTGVGRAGERPLRFLDRQEAAALADKYYGPPEWQPKIGLESRQFRENLFDAWKKAKADGDTAKAADLARQYNELDKRIEGHVMTYAPHKTHEFDPAPLLADSSRASLPGVLVNAAEQRPTAAKAERPVAAATRYNGEIFTGATHGQTIPAALAKYPEAERFLLDTVGHDADGFVTNTGRFVTRAEALALADAAGWNITRGRNMGLDAVELRANAAPPQRPRSVGDMLKQYGEDAQ